MYFFEFVHFYKVLDYDGRNKLHRIYYLALRFKKFEISISLVLCYTWSVQIVMLCKVEPLLTWLQKSKWTTYWDGRSNIMRSWSAEHWTLDLWLVLIFLTLQKVKQWTVYVACLQLLELVSELVAFQAYLSLPEGTASVAGLIAMMTDHYCNLVILVFIFYLVMFSFDCLTEPLLILVFINYLVMCSFDRFNWAKLSGDVDYAHKIWTRLKISCYQRHPSLVYKAY